MANSAFGGGFSGTSGWSGYSGFSGSGGVSGFSGVSGYSGTSGFSGYSGTSGFSGYSGTFSGGMSTQGQTSGTTGLGTAGLVLVGTNGIGLSQSTDTNGSNTLSFQPTPYISNWFPVYPINYGNSQLGNGNMFLWPVAADMCVTATRVNHYVILNHSSSSNSSYAGVLSLSFGVYTRTASTLSLSASGSQSYQWSNTSSNSYSVISGIRQFTIPVNINMTPGEYWLAIWSRSSTTNANWFSASNFLVHSGSASGGTPFGQSTNSSYAVAPGFGQYSNASTSGAMLASMNMSDIKGNNGAMMPLVQFQNISF